MAEQVIHLQLRKLSFTKDGTPYWATACGKPLPGEKPLVVTSSPKEVTCKRCAAPRS
jgi:hypothetical protein